MEEAIRNRDFDTFAMLTIRVIHITPLNEQTKNNESSLNLSPSLSI
jgi:hypothetical protein